MRGSHEPSALRGLKIALLGSDRLLVAADAQDDAAVALAGDQRAQPGRLARGVARGRRQRRIDGALGRADLVMRGQIPFADEPVAKLVDLGKLEARVEQRELKRNLAQEGLANHPEQRRRVFSDRPEHAERRNARERFAQNIDCSGLEYVEIRVGCGRHQEGLSASVIAFPTAPRPSDGSPIGVVRWISEKTSKR